MAPLGISCGKKDGAPKDQSSQVNIAALFDSRRDPFRNSQSHLLQRLVQTRGATKLRMWDAAGNANLQSNQFAAALAARPDFIFVFPVNPEVLAPALNRLDGSGPRIFVFADIVSKNPRSSVIVCPDAEVGRVTGEFLIQSLRLKAAEEGGTEPAGRIVELTTAPPAVSHAGYSDGLLKSIWQQPGITVVHQAQCKLLSEDTAERVKEALLLQKDFDVIFAHNDLIARAASKAVAAANPELIGRILVLGVDGNLGKGGGREMIIKGEIDASICRPPLVDLAWAITERCLSDPKFVPKPRYEVPPVALNYESAIEVGRTGIPTPPVD